MNVYHGRTATLTGGFETAFRTPGVAGQLLKFSTLEIGQEANLEDDPTINADPLVEKREDTDSTASATVNAILCANDIGWWLKALLGAPTTVAAGAQYAHTYTLTLEERPSTWLEVSLGLDADQRWHRFIGMALNGLNWDPMANNQSFSATMLGAVEVKPPPTEPLDDAPAAIYAKRRFCTKRTNLYDVLNANTLGRLNALNIQWANDLTGYALGDGQEGFGDILLGQPSVTGTLGGLFGNNEIFDHALNRESKTLVIDQADSTGLRKMRVTIPNIEFDKPKLSIQTSKGMVIEGLPWRAHKAAGANPVTVVLTNDVPAYA